MLNRSLVLLALLLAPARLWCDDDPDWRAPQAPFRIADNLYYVGSRDLAAYLITTPQGDILINGNLSDSAPQIEKSIADLGFKLQDVKILLLSHAHFDHAGGIAALKRDTRAQYMVMEQDVPVVESGGKADFAYGNSEDTGNFYPPVKVDRVLHDGDSVTLGGITLIAHLTPGHTKGCTTWTMRATDRGKRYNVVIIGSPNVNPGYKLVNNAEYPQIAADYEKTFRVLHALPCDIFLGAHGSYFNMQEKLQFAGSTGTNRFVDHAGYIAYVEDREQAFRKELAKQRREAAGHTPGLPTGVTIQ